MAYMGNAYVDRYFPSRAQFPMHWMAKADTCKLFPFCNLRDKVPKVPRGNAHGGTFDLGPGTFKLTPFRTF